MELLRSELMNQNIELKAKDNRIEDLVSMLAKCEYENVKNREQEMTVLLKDAQLKDEELNITKEELLAYVNKCESMREELEKVRDMSKAESHMQSKELKDLNKELVENKLLHEKKSAELDESQRTVGNLNTMVCDLQYVVKKLLLNSAHSSDVGSDVEEKIRKCNVKRTPSKRASGSASGSAVSVGSVGA